jgi:hypothetical protein
MKSVQKKITVAHGDDLQTSVLQMQKGIVKMAQEVGFKEVDEIGVEELLQLHSEPMKT